MDYKALGQQIRRCRKANGWTQAELAEKIDVSPSHVSHIENGTTKLSLQTLVDIASVLKVSADLLLFGNLPATSSTYAQELETVLSDCTPRDQAVVMEVVRKLGTVFADKARYEADEE